MATRPSNPRPSSEERRRELVQIAYRLIAERGLEGLRTRLVAAAAGIDTGTLHYHFPSKRALVQAVVDWVAEDFRTNRAQSGAPPANAWEELHNEIFDLVPRVRESPEQIAVMMELSALASRDPEVAEILARMGQGWTESLAGILARGVEQGLFRPEIQSDTAAFVLRTQLVGLGFVGMAAPERMEAIATELFRQMQTWLSK